MTLTVISDTHGKCKVDELLKGDSADVLIHCGDFTGGDISRTERSWVSPSHDNSFSTFLEELDNVRDYYKHVIVIPGNHDKIVELHPEYCKRMLANMDVHLLISESITIEGVKFFGHPWTPEFRNWFFTGDDRFMKLSTDAIDSDTNVLISHGPAYGLLDVEHFGDNVGCRHLYDKLLELKDLTHLLCGHIHESGGTFVEFEPDFNTFDVIDVYNASIIGSYYNRNAKNNQITKITI